MCFAVRKSRKTVAKDPRYKPSMIFVLQRFLQTDYARKRFNLFKELDGKTLDTVTVSEEDRKICRKVVRDFIRNSPLDFDSFSIYDFDDYVKEILHQTSEAYQEDITRAHDHLAECRMDSLRSYFFGYFSYTHETGLPYEFRNFLGGQECYFISVPRFSSFIPFMFVDMKLLKNNTQSVRDIWEGQSFKTDIKTLKIVKTGAEIIEG